MTAMAAGTTGTHVRAPGPTGAHARGKWSTREGRPLPRPGRGGVGTTGALGAVRTEHAVVVMAIVVVMPGDRSAGEEDNRHHENDAGDDHHPGRSLVEPRRFCYVRQRRRRRADGRRRDLGFGCLGHPSIMPTSAPTIKHPAHGVADESSARPDALPPRAQIRPGGYRPSSTRTRRNAE